MPGDCYHRWRRVNTDFSLDRRGAGLLPVGAVHQSVSNMTNPTTPEIGDKELVVRAKAQNAEAAANNLISLGIGG